MFDKDKYLERLRAMDPKDVADIVKRALLDAGIEPGDGCGEIIWPGLMDKDSLPTLNGSDTAEIPAQEVMEERNCASVTEKIGSYPNLMCFGAEPYNCGLENACPDYETCKAEHYRRWYSFMEAQKATGE